MTILISLLHFICKNNIFEGTDIKQTCCNKDEDNSNFYKEI